MNTYATSARPARTCTIDAAGRGSMGGCDFYPAFGSKDAKPQVRGLLNVTLCNFSTQREIWLTAGSACAGYAVLDTTPPVRRVHIYAGGWVPICVGTPREDPCRHSGCNAVTRNLSGHHPNNAAIRYSHHGRRMDHGISVVLRPVGVPDTAVGTETGRSSWRGGWYPMRTRRIPCGGP